MRLDVIDMESFFQVDMTNGTFAVLNDVELIALLLAGKASRAH